MKPTDEKIKWFWEQCDLKEEIGNNEYHRWYGPGGNLICAGYQYKIPDILDLNNLFKYAVPKLVEIIGKHMAYLLLSNCLGKAILLGEKLEDDIFWAIYKALGGKE